jgi:glucan biosynthesis protein C
MPLHAPQTAPPAEPGEGHPREPALDALRVAALAGLIAYHVGMFYVPWDWHVKSPQSVPALVPWMLLLAPWRLGLLFLVAGAALAPALHRRPPRPWLRRRLLRLGAPLLFGMAVVVPPQAYMEVRQQLQWAGSYTEFLRLYFQGHGGFCDTDGCLVLPTWNHLWFLPYLALYTAMAALLHRGSAGRCWAWSGWARLGQGAHLVWWPALWLGAVRLLLLQRFPSTHDLLHDGFNHALYGSMFGLGLAVLGAPGSAAAPSAAPTAWATARHWRWPLTVGAVALLLGLPLAAQALPRWPDWAQPVWTLLGGARHWWPLLAALGWASQALQGARAPAWGPRLRAWSAAILPVYLVHQTITVLAGPALVGLGWPQPLEALALLAVTVAGCVLFVAVSARSGPGRMWCGWPPRR